jgi:hypothetical protein
MTIKTTVKMWSKVTPIDDRQSENLNGGQHTSLYVGVSGGTGGLQINGVDGAQINLHPKDGNVKYRHSYYSYHGNYYC